LIVLAIDNIDDFVNLQRHLMCLAQFIHQIIHRFKRGDYAFA
jgi:hypothetical protein